MQTLIVSCIVLIASLYALRLVVPQALRRKLAGVTATAARKLGIGSAGVDRVAATISGGSGCGSCGPCKACSTGSTAHEATPANVGERPIVIVRPSSGCH